MLTKSSYFADNIIKRYIEFSRPSAQWSANFDFGRDSLYWPCLSIYYQGYVDKLRYALSYGILTLFFMIEPLSYKYYFIKARLVFSNSLIHVSVKFIQHLKWVLAF